MLLRESPGDGRPEGTSKSESGSDGGAFGGVVGSVELSSLLIMSRSLFAADEELMCCELWVELKRENW